jgi:sporulation protein YlmC with PRC-barrel domain
MKTLIWFGATTVVVAVAAMISAQSEIPNGSSSNSRYVQNSKLVGRKVKSSDGTEIGVVKDVVIDRINGCMAYTVVSAGGAGTGVISGGGKIVAIPWAVYSPTSDPNILTVNVDRDKVYHAPAFESTRMDEYARPDYINNVYSYYGVSPGPRTASAAGTDVTGTAGATASPGQVASPAAGGPGSPNEKPSARMHASSAAGSYEVSSATRSPKAIRSARAINAQTSVDRGETASPEKSEKFPSESTTSPNEKKKSRRKAIEDSSIRRPSTTPQSAEGED